MIWYTCTLWNDYHTQVNTAITSYSHFFFGVNNWGLPLANFKCTVYSWPLNKAGVRGTDSPGPHLNLPTPILHSQKSAFAAGRPHPRLFTWGFDRSQARECCSVGLLKEVDLRSRVGCGPWGRWASDRLSDSTFTFHFHALEKEMATHSSVLAWRIRGTGEPGGLPSVGSQQSRTRLSDSAAAAACVNGPGKFKPWLFRGQL